MIWCFGKMPRMEDEVQARCSFVVQVKYPSLLTDRYRTSEFSMTLGGGSAKYGFSGKHLKWKMRYS